MNKIEIEKFDVKFNHPLANVIEVNGIKYIRADCMNKQLIDLDEALKELRYRIKSTKIIKGD